MRRCSGRDTSTPYFTYSYVRIMQQYTYNEQLVVTGMVLVWDVESRFCHDAGKALAERVVAKDLSTQWKPNANAHA